MRCQHVRTHNIHDLANRLFIGTLVASLSVHLIPTCVICLLGCRYAEIAKQAAIAAAELSKRTTGGSLGGSIMSRLMERLVGMIQIKINDVHARVEVDRSVHPA
jgi:hypothetical protein